MATANATSVSSFFGLLRDFWLMEGVPARLWDESGQRWMAIAKMADQNWTGDGEIQFPSRSELPTAGSQSLAVAWANSNPSGNDKWVVTDNERWQVMQLNWKIMELSSDKQRAYLTSRQAEQEAHMRRFNNIMSYLCYQNGGNAIARLREGFTSSGQTVLQLENPKTAKFFEGSTRDGIGGDQIEFSVDDGTGASLGGTRATEIRRVTQVNAQAGTITVTPALDTPIEDRDFIFFQGDYARGIRGSLAWNPVTNANLSTPFFGVDRSRREDRLAGVRLPYEQGAQPYTIVQSIIETANDLDLRINRLTIQNSEWTRFMHDLHAQNVTYRVIRTESNAATMQVGFTAMQIIDARLREPLMVYADRYWEHPELDASQQGGLYLADNTEDSRFYMFPSGLSWKDYDGTGSLKQIIGSQVLGANFGCFGQNVVKNTKNQLISGPSGFVVN